MQTSIWSSTTRVPERSPATRVRSLREAAALFFRHPSPRIIAAKLALVLTVRVALGGYGWWDLAVVAAVALYWPLQEWVAHIYVLHMKPLRLFGRSLDTQMARVHRDHHRRPWNIETAFLPPRFLLLFAIPINIAFWLLVMPTRELAVTGMAAFSAMALLYEWTHYLTHTAYSPRTKLYRTIFRNHRLHHFKNEHYWHSFIAPTVDRMFHTAPDPHDVETSPTCHTLGIAGDELGDDAAGDREPDA